MKKLFIIVSIVFSIFLVSDEVFALEYEVNGTTYQVDSVENYRDYCYFTYFKDKGKSSFSVLVFYSSDNTYFSSYCFVGNYINLAFRSNAYIFENSNGGGSYTDIYSFNTSNYRTGYSNDWRLQYYNSSPSYFYSNKSYNGFTPTTVFTVSDMQGIEDRYTVEPTYYTITYYLNNEVYREIEVEEGTSHTLIYYEPNSDYNFSGWDYGNANLSNIQSDITITGTTTLKPYYTISYYLNSELYNSVSVIEGTNYSLVDYVPPKNYQFSGWTYDSNIDLSNIQSNVNIFGTSVYVRPQMTYNEESNSIIHNLSYEILGNDVPVEFDYVYTLVDYLILLILVFCAIVPFLIVFKLLGGW